MKRTLLLCWSIVLVACSVDNVEQTDWEQYTDTDRGVPKPLGEGRAAIVVGTSGGKAVAAGLQMLREGGTAVDAGLTTSLAQIAETAGAAISYAGILNMVYYEAETDKLYSMNANFNSVLGEDDPLTIPTASFVDPKKDKPTPSGRTAFVPGFMAGVAAAHGRFGKLPFDAIFQPAIRIAEGGFVLNPGLVAGGVERSTDILSRLPETKAVFTKGNGEFYQVGDLFRQPALAETLRHVAEQGIDYIYRGPWAKKFVAAVQADGGKMTVEDLARYEVEWDEPAHLSYHGYDVYAFHEAFRLLGALNLLEAADLTARGHYTESADVFYWFHKIIRATSAVAEGMVERTVPAVPREHWLDKAKGQEYWQQLRDGTFPILASNGGGPRHSAAVVAADQWGNVVAILHSINTVLWGETGIFVDGISIPDAASFQQRRIANTEPGHKVFAGTLPLIVMSDGKPIVAMSSIGSGLFHETVKVLVNTLDYGYDPKTANDAPSFLNPGFSLEGVPDQERVLEGEFDPTLLAQARELGLEVDEVPRQQAGFGVGFVVNLRIDTPGGPYFGAVSRFGTGRALGY